MSSSVEDIGHLSRSLPHNRSQWAKTVQKSHYLTLTVTSQNWESTGFPEAYTQKLLKVLRPFPAAYTQKLKIVRPFPAVFTHCGTYKINDMNQKRLRNTAVAASVWWPQWLLHQVQITWTTFVINYFDESLSLDSSKVGHQWCHRTYNHKLESSIERGDYGLVNHAAVRHKMTGLRHETE